ncbi:MAG: Eco57I restriction-modification methylase domain-containing protein [Alphaproteobacteria bacterium]
MNDLAERLNYTPDVLNCLANLSNDEVFTPPNVVNDMLDMLPVELWGDKKSTFLDPCTKSGVFLREIVKRLDKGLEKQIPDKIERINHILKNQVFGIPITELTSLISRRSVYCAKIANGDLSVVGEAFDNEQGNIKMFDFEHSWKNDDKCEYCGVNKNQFDRGEELESYAYDFIHTDEPQELFKDEKGKEMRFDVIIGNPPYQMSTTDESQQAIPLYHRFIQQAKKLQPRYLSMIIPARWYTSGMGLQEFRSEMLNDDRIRVIVDFQQAEDCFNGVEIKGGVCYFLWDRDNKGHCNVVNMDSDGIKSEMTRPLLVEDMDTFIRYNQSINILNKVMKNKEDSFSKIVSIVSPFGFPTNFRGAIKKTTEKNIKIYTTKSTGYVSKSDIPQNDSWVERYKIYISQAYNAGDNFPHQILGKPFLGEKKTCSSATYLLIGTFDNKETAENVLSYITTKFFRFMVMLKKISQHTSQKVYELVPMQDFSKQWTDEELYKKYKLTKDEIDYIEEMIKPMELSDG